MNVVVISPPVGQPVDQVGIAVIGEDDRLVRGEDLVEGLMLEAVRMLLRVLQGQKIDHIDRADLQIGNCFMQQHDGCERLHGRDIARASHHDVGGDGIVLVACPVPYADAGLAVGGRFIDAEPLRFRLLAGDDDIDPIIGPQAMIADP